MHISNLFYSYLILLITALLNLSLERLVVDAFDVKNQWHEELQDVSTLISELIQDLSTKLKKVPLPLLKNKVIAQTLRASESLDLPNPEDDDCERNFSDLCPKNWIPLGDGEYCLSPLEYTGPCQRKVSFQNATPLSKFTFSTNCNVAWPCMNECIQDFSQFCPNQWILQLDYSCQAPSKYKGNCVRRKSFETFSESEKEAWAKECDVEWPCQRKNYDFKYLCPAQWKMSPDEKRCTAPDFYVGPCASTLYLFGLKDEEKRTVMSKCKIEWPIHGNTKTFDFDNFCPLGWKLKDVGNQTCVAPTSYMGPCRKEVSFVSFSKEEKYDFSKKCDVQWRSADEKIQDFTFPCPYNWLLTNKEEQICVAPVEYDGPCETIFSFKNYSKEMKAAWASACRTVFMNGSISAIKSLNEQSRNRIMSKKRIIETNQLSNVEQAYLPLSVHDGPIGIMGTKYYGEVVPANKETVYAINKKNIVTDDDVIELENIGEMKNKEFIFSDDKIRDLKLLKESSTDEDFKRTVEQTILDIKKRYSKGTAFSFIQYTEEEVDFVKSLYENYEIEKGSMSYREVCSVRDYTKCPIGWTRINNNECLAPKSYIRSKRKCSSILKIGNMNKRVYDVSHDMSFDMIDIKARQQLEQDCNINFPCKECERDYIRVPCPIGWTILDNGSCKAPNDYPKSLRKLCGEIVNFVYATPAFRKNWSFLCKADWPCFSICEKNYGAICPIGYKLINERKEQAHSVHVCANETWKPNIQAFEIEGTRTSYKENTNICHVIEVYNAPLLKKEIEDKCKVQWPCLKKCEENFYQTCPYGWIFNENKCIAPYYYNPPKGCARSFDVFSFSNLDKFIFSTKCFAPWPCQNSCQPDWTVVCPDGWDKIKVNNTEEEQKPDVEIEDTQEEEKEVEKEDASEEEEYVLKQNEIKREKGKSGNINININKRNINKKDLHDEEFIHNYNDADIQNIYEGLKKHKEQIKYTCKPPKHYKGTCHGSYDFINFTFAQKQDFSFRCKVKWPCGKKVHHTENWQTKDVYVDKNFKNLQTLKHYNPEYIFSYNNYVHHLL